MSTISSGTTSTTTLIHSGDTTGSLVFKTNDTGSGGTTAMTIDTSQNVGIGTTSPAAKFHSAGGIIATGSASAFTATAGIMDTSGGNARITATGADSSTYGVLTFNRGSSNASLFQESMRIDSGGKLILATTTNGTAGTIQAGITANTGGVNGVISVAANSSGAYPFAARGEDSSQGLIGFFNSSNSTIGSISKSGSNVAYNTSSDYRLKDNIAPMTGALATVGQLKPVTYKWKADGSDGQGFIAHELQEVVPDCVTGAKDAVDADGNPVYQGVDTSFLVATLTAAIQELKAINDQQAQTITALTARIEALENK